MPYPKHVIPAVFEKARDEAIEFCHTLRTEHPDACEWGVFEAHEQAQVWVSEQLEHLEPPEWSPTAELSYHRGSERFMRLRAILTGLHKSVDEARSRQCAVGGEVIGGRDEMEDCRFGVMLYVGALGGQLGLQSNGGFDETLGR